MDTTLIGKGFYSLPRASKLVGADLRAIRRWMLGYSRRYKGEDRFSPPLWRTQYAGDELPEPSIGFKDLLELRLVNAFVKHGVDLRVIRATAEAASRLFGNDYPFTMKRFLTDGRTIFAEAVSEIGGESSLIDAAKGQYVFSEIIKPSLYAGIEYDGGAAMKWYPEKEGRSVVLDPQTQFGAPIVADVSIPTDTLYASFLAEGRDRNAAARIFDVEARHIDVAVHFEERLAA